MDKNRRKHQRFRAAVAAEIEHEGELHEGETRDLSQGGAAVFLIAPLRQGMHVSLTLFLTEDGIEAPDEEPLELPAEVIWTTPQRQGALLVGLRFIGLEAPETERLSQLLAALETD